VVTAASREFPRYAHEAEIRIRWGTEELVGITRNVSRGGLAAMIFGQIPVRANVALAIRLRFPTGETSEALSLPARVVWCTGLDDGYQIGVTFLALDSTQAQFLDVFLRMLGDPVEPRIKPVLLDDKFRDE